VRSLKQSLKRLSVEPDCVLTGASDRRTRIAAVGALSGFGWRGGFTLAPQLYQRELEYSPTKSLIDNNLQLAVLTGCRAGHSEPRVYFSSADVAVATNLLRVANPEGKPLVVMVTQNSGGQRTGWHQERFVAVIRCATDVLGCCVVFVGTEKDGTAVEQLRTAAAGVGTSLTGRTSVTELAALLAMSDAVVSLDTGTMHVGRAVGVPMVVIGPSWQNPLEWLPLGLPQVRILRGKDRDDVPEGYQLDEVVAAAVCSSLAELMTAYPPSASGREKRVQSSISDVDHRA
jgi:ADP-heptose:LPS heptosyltransferase